MARFIIIGLIVLGAGYSIYTKSVNSAEESEAAAASKPATEGESGGAAQWASDAMAKTVDVVSSIAEGEDAEPKPDPMVSCVIQDKSRFMLQGDCITRGGHVRYETSAHTQPRPPPPGG